MDGLYFDNDEIQFKLCLNLFEKEGLSSYTLASKSKEDTVIGEIANADKPINATLYRSYANNLRKAVDSVFFEDNDDSGLSDQLRANVSRFAAYKSYHATTQIKRNIDETGSVTDAKKVLHAFNRYQAAEYNTSVARCRTAKQWQEFETDDNRRLFPNIRWIPSRSATPREAHRLFWNRIWPKDHPFWNANQPGNLWNCKCDWEETDSPATDGNPADKIAHNGLDGNPAKTGEVFTDNCTYVKRAGKNRTERDRVEMICEIAAQNLIKQTSTQNQLLTKSYKCEIEGNMQDIHFSDWGISETAHSMNGKKDLYWLKNEVLNNADKYFKQTKYISSANVDLTHNTSKKRIALKKKFIRYYYSEITLANGQPVYLNIVLHKDGKYYLYTISKKITDY